MATHPSSSDDICVWPDGTWCYRCEVHEYTHKSDAYEILYVDSELWLSFDPDRPLHRALEA